ncbi:hypothetical protein EDF70_102850 [Neorhizobium sp. JUb45]|nr:hypothetical protein EDF70_102850 [Neorhizobium sp. JUb45]
MSRKMAFPMGVHDQHETASRNLAHLSVTGFVFYGSIKPDGQHRLWYLVPRNFPHTLRNMSDPDT